MIRLARAAAAVVLVLASTAGLATDKPADTGHLWKISRAGTPDSFVFGTIHLADPRVAGLPPPVRESMAKTATLAIEMVPERMDARSAELELLDGGDLLEPLLGRDLYARLEAELVSRGLQPALIARLKPWAAMMKLGRAADRSGEPTLDAQLFDAARAQRMKILPLEMIEEQVSAFDTIPLKSQVALLRHAIVNRDSMAATIEPTILAWQRGHFRALEAAAGIAFERHPEMGAHRAELMRNIIDNRTVLMHHRLSAPLRSGRVFVAIGALHLAGPRGLLAMLRADGYRLTPVW
jgi:uncharacterized protein